MAKNETLKSKKSPETLWRLVDAKCAQLKDTISSARVALLAVLAWTFVIFIALYNHEYGYTAKLLGRYEAGLARVVRGESACAALLVRGESKLPDSSWVGRYHPLLAEIRGISKEKEVEKNALCYTILDSQHKVLLQEQVKSWQIGIPGTGSYLYVFDMGVAGQAGMILLLLWFFFATRRENHAIRSFVDIPDDGPVKDRWMPRSFILMPKDKFLSAEHYCFAYHAVAQRFMFLFSSKVGPLLLLTMSFIFLPLIVCLWNSATDVRDLFNFDLGQDGSVRSLLSVLLLSAIAIISVLSARHTIQSSVLLNGWYLASRDVWVDDWDETNEDPAPPVRVSREEQKASRFDTK